MNLPEITKKLNPVKGQRLSNWLNRFLIASPEQLSNWSGHFTDIITAKAVEVLRRRGVIEEQEANKARFALLLNACYRAKKIEN